MRVVVSVHPAASVELEQAQDYYAEIDPDLAIRLLAEHDTAIAYIRSFPEAGPWLFRPYRHVVLPSFPYMIVFRHRDGAVRVLAIMHLRRDPQWVEHAVAGRE